MNANTLFLRLEGPLQAWGDQQSKFVVRRTAEAPTKSGVIGMLCAALGVPPRGRREWLPRLSALRMGVRIDRPGVRWWDYHTVGAGMQMRIAEGEGKSKPGAMLTRREYLCDASFLVALQGELGLVAELDDGTESPEMDALPRQKVLRAVPPFAGASARLFSRSAFGTQGVPWRRRLKGDPKPESVTLLSARLGSRHLNSPTRRMMRWSGMMFHCHSTRHPIIHDSSSIRSSEWARTAGKDLSA